MSMVFFRYTFAESGDKTAVPEATQPSGVVSYQQGYGSDYELDPDSDPDGKYIDRRTFNQVLSDVTSAIKQYQTLGVPEWITAAQNGGVDYPYSQGARVAYRASGLDPWVAYESMVDNNTDTPGTTANWQVISVPSVVPAYGECQLVIDGSDLRLNPYNGNAITINGTLQEVPSAGVALAIGAAAANTTYYIYAYMVSTTMTLQFSATAPTIDSATGMRVKTGDAAKTLVGIARTDAGPAWSLVRSWFNDPGVSVRGVFTATRTISSPATAFTEFNSEIRCAFLCWSGERVKVTGTGGGVVDLGSGDDGYGYIAVAFDGTTAEDGASIVGAPAVGGQAASDWLPISPETVKTGLSEGYHYATLVGKIIVTTGSGIDLVCIGSATAGERTALAVTIN